MLISLIHLYLRLLRLWKIPRRLILVARCWMHAFHILLLPTWWHFFTLCICPDSPVLLIFLVVDESRWASATSTETRLYEILGVVDDISPVQRHGHRKNMLFSYPPIQFGDVFIGVFQALYTCRRMCITFYSTGLVGDAIFKRYVADFFLCVLAPFFLFKIKKNEIARCVGSCHNLTNSLYPSHASS